MPTEHIIKAPGFHGTETNKLSFDRLVRSLREALHGLRNRTPKKPETAPVVKSGADFKHADARLPRKERRNDTPTGLRHSVFEGYSNERLADILREKAGQQYIVIDDDVQIRKRSEAVKTLEYDLRELKAEKIETVSNDRLATMLKKRFDKVIVVPDDHSAKVATRSDAIEWLRKLIKRDIL